MIGIIEEIGGGSVSDDVTATKNLVLKGYTAVTKDSDDEPIEGTLDVQSIQSFSVESTGARRITLTWKNPSKGAFSGVIVRYSPTGYPEQPTQGTNAYRGYGSSMSPNGISQVEIELPSANTTYYFTAFSYAIKNGTDWIHPSNFKSSAKTTVVNYDFTSSTTFRIPNNVNYIDIFCVGGGGGGGNNYNEAHNGGGGGAGGYAKTFRNVKVTPGQTYTITIGSGGSGAAANAGWPAQGTNGGTTSFGNLASASGGGSNTGLYYGGNGGSGGGAGVYWGANPYQEPSYYRGGSGGSNGSNGGRSGRGDAYEGKGQGTTTKAFGTGRLCSGGGGGGMARRADSYVGGLASSGGAGGGGYCAETGVAVAGSNGYGGGGGGAGMSWSGCPRYGGARGGSGFLSIILR